MQVKNGTVQKENFIHTPPPRRWWIPSVVNNKKNVIPCLTRNLSGFTLIELLVVVLIIGILASIAVPQYQKAVEKSRATQAWTVLASLIQAQKSYHLATNNYAAHFDELTLELPWTGQEMWANTNVTDTRSNGRWSLQLWNGSTTQGNNGLYIGQIIGRYKGTGFTYYFQNNISIPNDRILCAERTGRGVLFDQTPGDYCQRIFKGTSVFSDSNTRLYAIP